MKKVLIISTQFDPSTDAVLDWLACRDHAFIRLNGNEILSLHSQISIGIENTHASFTIDPEDQQPDLRSIWFRRDVSYQLPADTLAEIKSEPYYKVILQGLKDEYANAKIALYSSLTAKNKSLGNFRKYRINKIDTLITAQRNGLDVPATLITNVKAEVCSFFTKHKKIITKAISESISFWKEQAGGPVSYSSYTEEITRELLDSMPERFNYSLFQEKLDKDFDIRAFYLDGKCYSMAIISGKERSTHVDCRKYGRSRKVPYSLCEKLEKHITEFMQEMGLDTGSIDLVKTKEGRYVFLEVNPFGQFGMTSVPCNYYLEKRIADHLITL